MSTAALFRPGKTLQPTPLTKAMELVSRLAGVQIDNPMDEVFFTQQGVQPSAIDSLKQLGMSTGDLVWIIKPRTLSHRKVNREKLTQDETGRWLRAAKIHALAIVVFGDPDKAARWLHSPRKQFGGMAAATLIQTEAGAQLVEETLGQLDSGYFA